MPLTLPWIAAPLRLAEGDTVTLGRAAGLDVTWTVAVAVTAGTLLGFDAGDGRLHPVTATNTERTRT